MDTLQYPNILIIYTGGTIGMIENPETGALENFDFEQFRHHVPELKRFNYNIDALAFDPPIDSSDMEPRYWVKMAHIIADKDVEVLEGRTLMGHSSYPIVLEKGSVV